MYELLSYIRRSSIKRKILQNLQEAKTPTDLKKSLGVHRESISSALIDLEGKKLVNCLTPDQPNYRYYELTELGRQLVKKINAEKLHN